jgi:hypothetical protein
MVAPIGAVSACALRTDGGLAAREVRRITPALRPSKRLKRWDDPEWRRRFAVFICRKLDIPFNPQWEDPRYIQARRAEFDPDIQAVWVWWCDLHWKTRRFFIARFGDHSLRVTKNADDLPIDVKGGDLKITFADVVVITKK